MAQSIKNLKLIRSIAVILFLISGIVGTSEAQSSLLRRQQQPQLNKEQLQVQKASFLEREGKLEDAAAIYQRLLSQNPDNNLIYSRYRDVLIQMSEFEIADSLIQTHLKKHPRDIESLVTLGTVYYNQNQKDKALRQWKSVIDVFGNNMRSYQSVLTAMLQNGLLNEADKLVQQARKALGQPDFYALQLGAFYAARMDYTKATQEYLLYYESNHANVSFFVAQISRFPDEPDVQKQVVPVLKKAIDENPHDNQMVHVLADYEYRIQNYNDALKYYSRLESLEKQPGKYRRQVAQDFMDDGEYQRSKNLYQELLTDSEIKSDRKSLQYGYAEASYKLLVSQNRTPSEVDVFHHNLLWDFQFVVLPESAGPALDSIVTSYNTILKQYPNSREAQMAEYRLGEIYFRLGNDFDRALKYFKACADNRRHPMQIQAKLNMGFCYLAKADTAAARNQWVQLRTELQNSPPEIQARARFFLASTYLYSGDLKTATKQFANIQKELPVKSDMFNDILEVQTLIDDGLADQNKTDTTTVRQFFKAEFYIKQHNITEAQRELLGISDKFPHAPITPYALMRAAQLARVLGQSANVTDWLGKIVNNYKDSPVADQATFLLAEFYQYDQQNRDQAMHWYEQVLVNYPGSLLEQRARTVLRQLQQETS